MLKAKSVIVISVFIRPEDINSLFAFKFGYLYAKVSRLIVCFMSSMS